MKSHAAIEILHDGKSLGHFVVDQSGSVTLGPIQDARSALREAESLASGAPGVRSTVYSSADVPTLTQANGQQVEARKSGETVTFPLGTFHISANQVTSSRGQQVDMPRTSITFDPAAPARIFV